MNQPWWFVVEDDQVDVSTIERGLRKLGMEIQLGVVPNGFDVPGQLRSTQIEYGGEPPDLMLIDINLPLANGHEVLEQLSRDPDSQLIPKLVLTTSDREEDIRGAYACGASGYFVKSQQFGDFVDTLSTILDYWAKAKRP